jgi:murein DD-endopeptidase MepM/ murein hydrolase activator NlpD
MPSLSLDLPETHAIESRPVPARKQPSPGARQRPVLSVLAGVVFVASLFALGPDGLIPLGLLLAFSVDSDEQEMRRSVALTRHNLWLAAAITAGFGWFWLWHLDLTQATLVVVGGVLIALPLAFRESVDGAGRERVVALTRRSIVLAVSALVVSVNLYFAYGKAFDALATACVVLPLALAVSRALNARRGRLELGLLRHPLRRDVRPHLTQVLNIWLCAALLGAVLTVGGAHVARTAFSLNAAELNVVTASFAGGLLLLAALALVPRRRVYLATNLVVAMLSGFLALQLGQLSVPLADPIVLDSPLTGEWLVSNGGRSVLLNGHSPNESNSVDLRQLGANGRTHTGGDDAGLADYAGFGSPLLAPADGRVVEVTDGFADNPPGTNGAEANHLVMDIGNGRYVLMAHLEQGSVTVRVGDVVRRGQPLAAVGNSGHTDAPHLHLQVQDTAAPTDADRTYPMVFRDVQITRAGAWPWGDSRELRTGDLVSARSGQ